MSIFGRASAILLLLSIPVSWLLVSLSGIEISPQITHGRYFILFILLFVLVGFVLACIALFRKEGPGYFAKVTFVVALCAVLFFGWVFARWSGADNAGASSGAVASDSARRNAAGGNVRAVSAESGGDRVASGATVTDVEDWGSGFNAGYECLLPGSGAVFDFLITFNYSGDAGLTTGWMLEYGGAIDVGNIAPDGGFAIKPMDEIPYLNAGDKLSFIVQGRGAGFDAADFDVQCTR